MLIIDNRQKLWNFWTVTLLIHLCVIMMHCILGITNLNLIKPNSL